MGHRGHGYAWIMVFFYLKKKKNYSKILKMNWKDFESNEIYLKNIDCKMFEMGRSCQSNRRRTYTKNNGVLCTMGWETSCEETQIAK